MLTTLLLAHNIPVSGSIIKQPKLAATLTQLGRKGHKGFYQGEVANNIISDLQKAGAAWTPQDLNDYKVIERPPIFFKYKGSSVTTTPPPSYGGVALHQALKAIERSNTSDITVKKSTPMNIKTEMPTNESEAFMSQISIIDQWGNKASVSLSMNMPFGSAFTSPTTGILLNNSLAKFTASPNSRSEIDVIEPGKRPQSYMTPTLIESSDSLTIIGASSGKHTSTTLLLTILNYVDNASASQKATLEAMGHNAQEQQQKHSDLQIVHSNRTKGRIEASSSPTGGGQAIVR